MAYNLSEELGRRAQEDFTLFGSCFEAFKGLLRGFR